MVHPPIARRIATREQRCLLGVYTSVGEISRRLVNAGSASVRKEMIEFRCTTAVNGDWQLRYRSIGLSVSHNAPGCRTLSSC